MVAPPTSLPALRKLDEHSVADISRKLGSLRQLYWPPPKLPVPRARPSRLQRLYSEIPDSGYASAVVSDDEGDGDEPVDSDSDPLEQLRADPFERACAIKWITGLIARIDLPTADGDAEDARDNLLEEASALLAQFSPTFTVEVELNDAPLSNSDHTSVGLQSWGSAIVLAERLCADPASFDLVSGRPLRILELGAGTGLLSIAVAKLLPHSTVIATDYHPAILANLGLNIRTNFPLDPARITAVELDWAQPVLAGALDAPFDVILAADVVYHCDHARWIRVCVERLLRRPNSTEKGGTFHLIVPLRISGRNEGMDRTVDEAFGSDSTASGTHRLAISHADVLGRRGAGVGRADETGYRVFTIGWVTC
ncbi:putative methyltransferase-domain-containing protein [Roridomyces roridus]|uniref:Methyltransferase-domain-containing protein n=1 Tax=Roridomyces roridus TaxID=1738132 RepID=A0AAD7FQV8_9AGAR|nr:putative methyltransferase-domain-containing protein [Roridomyces roridus]